jgi:ubiquinone biosynthesis protein COQ9
MRCPRRALNAGDPRHRPPANPITDPRHFKAESFKERQMMETMRAAIVEAILPQVPFDGWSDRALRAALDRLGSSREQGRLAFPGGISEIIAHWSALSDEKMEQILAGEDLAAMRIRDRVAFAVRTRIEVDAPHREAVRRVVSHLALPWMVPAGVRLTYATLDRIWYACGDTATDYNFYTKRALLAAVYSSTVLFWIDDDSEDSAATWAFLARRIDEVMQIPRLKAQARSACGKVAAPLLAPLQAMRQRLNRA